MNRLLTLTSGGLFATMAILPLGAFAQTGAAVTQDNKTPAVTSAPTSSNTKTAAPATAQTQAPQAGMTDTKPATVAKHEGKHTVPAEASKPALHGSVQPKASDQSKS